MLEKTILSFGEVLWDIFPDGKRLGGAPLNFAYYFKKAGGNPIIISSVGRDKLGNLALEKIKGLGLDISCIQQVNRPTGKVDVSLESERHRFEILKNTAWEHIRYPDNKIIGSSLGIYFGTIAMISQRNRITLDRLMEDIAGEVIFFDLNLRRDFYNVKDISGLMTKANYLKLNSEEAKKLKDSNIIGGTNEESIINKLIEKYRLKACVITLGERGAVGGNKDGIFRVGGIRAKSMGDTVGCGDAFAATWLACLLKGKTMGDALYEANKIASRVASERGAIVEV